MDLFEKIKALRTERKLSQKEMAEFLGISQAAYAKIENPTDRDSKKISIEYGKIIAKALKVSFNELFEIESSISFDLKDKLKEIEELKKENDILREQLNDKRIIIDFLSSKAGVAATLLNETREPIKYDLDDVQSLIHSIESRPYDPSEPESIKKYVMEKLQDLINRKTHS